MEEKLKTYIQQCIAQDQSREDITKSCLGAGWTQELINQIFQEIDNSTPSISEATNQIGKETWKIKIVALWFVLEGLIAFLIALGSFVGTYLSTRPAVTADFPIHPAVFVLSGILMISLGVLSFKISRALHRLDRSGYLSALISLGTITISSLIFAIASYFLYRDIPGLFFGMTSVLINGLLFKLLHTDKTQFSSVESKPNLKKFLIVNYFLLLVLTPFLLSGKDVYVPAPASSEFDQGKIIFSAFRGTKPEPCNQIFELDLETEKVSLITDNGGGFVVSPDETKMVYRDGGNCHGTYKDRKDYRVYLYDFGGKQSKELPQVINSRNFVWNSDSQRLLYTTSEGLGVFDTDTQAANLIVGKPEPLDSDWINDNQVVFNQRLTEINRVDIASRQVSRVTDGAEISVSPDNQTGAIVRLETHKIFLVDLNTPLSEKRLTSLSSDIEESNPVWSPGGKMVAFEIQRKYELSNIAIIDVNSQKILFQSSDGGVNPYWSSSGEYLAFFSGKETIHLISPDGDFHKKIITDKGTIHDIAWITE